MAGTSGDPERHGDPDGSAVRGELVGKIGRSLLTVAVVAALPACGTFGAFDNRDDPFPHSVIAPLEEQR